MQLKNLKKILKTYNSTEDDRLTNLAGRHGAALRESSGSRRLPSPPVNSSYAFVPKSKPILPADKI